MHPHPFAEIFPPMLPDEYRELSSDIAKNGLIEPIVLYQGMILDGRNRYNICHGLDVAIKTVDFEPKKVLLQFKSADEQALDFVISKNLHRRHLTAGQKAMVAQELLPHYEEINKSRMLAGRKMTENGYSTNIPSPGPNSDQGSLQMSKKKRAPRSTVQAGQAVGVGKDSVHKAKKLATEAPDLAEQVKTGTMTLNAATKESETRKGKNRKSGPPKKFDPDIGWSKSEKLLDKILAIWPDEYREIFNGLMREWVEYACKKSTSSCNDQ